MPVAYKWHHFLNVFLKWLAGYIAVSPTFEEQIQDKLMFIFTLWTTIYKNISITSVFSIILCILFVIHIISTDMMTNIDAGIFVRLVVYLYQ